MTEDTKNVPIPSATILIVRDGAKGIEVFMVVRHHQIDFASGALVFPGGKVDPTDISKELRHFCHGAGGLTDEELGYRVSAIREVFEESGILIARKKEGDCIILGKELSSLKGYRAALADKELTICEFLEKENLVLALDLLVPYSHWVTPVVMPKRFDTVFFLVKAPSDHIGTHDGKESIDSVWITPQEALNDAESGKKTIIFPTRMNLKKLAKYPNVEEAKKALGQEQFITVTPVVEDRNGELFLCIPEEAGYGVTEEALGKIKGNPKPE